MAAKKVTLKFDMQLETEQREGYFATRTAPFAITSYGNTSEESEKRAIKAVSLLLDQHDGELDKVRNFLNHRGVKHLVYKQGEETRQGPLVVRSCRREIQLEVLAGA